MNKQELESVVSALPEELKQAIIKEKEAKKMSHAARARWEKATPEYRKEFGKMLVKSRNQTPKAE